MKITILDPKEGEEEEIIVKCKMLDDDLLNLLNRFKQGDNKLNGYCNGKIQILEQQNIYYFEAVDQKVFAYTKEQVYEMKYKLYELEEKLATDTFLRCSKSMIMNLDLIKQINPGFNGRFEAILKNGEKIMISRQYVPLLKKKLGL